MALLAAGDELPQVTVRFKQQRVAFSELLQKKRIIILGVSGAFSPVCTEIHLQGFRESLDLILALGVEFVAVLSVNDPFVLNAWAKQLDMGDHVVFMADPDASLTRSLGLLEDMTELGLGLRCRRCAIIAGPQNKVQWIGLDGDAFAPNVLEALKQGPQQQQVPQQVQQVPQQVPQDEVQSSGGQTVAEFLDNKPAGQAPRGITVQQHISQQALVQLEWEIRGPPRRGSAAVVKYELKRSQCNLLADEEEDEEEDEDDDDDEDDESVESDSEEDGGGSSCRNQRAVRGSDESCYGKFMRHFRVADCVPRHIGERPIKLACDTHDVKIRFNTPAQVLLKRVQLPRGTEIDPGYKLTFEPLGTAAGYIAMHGERYYLREVSLRSPSLHHRMNAASKQIETSPLELQLVLATCQLKKEIQRRRRNGQPPVPTSQLSSEFPPEQRVRVAALCVPLVWDSAPASLRSTTDAASTFVQQLAAVMDEWQEGETEREVEYTDCKLDLTALLASNTLSAFFSYRLDEPLLEPRPESTASLDEDNKQVHWLVSRGAISLALRDIQALSRILASPNLEKLAVAAVVDSALNSVNSPPTTETAPDNFSPSSSSTPGGSGGTATSPGMAAATASIGLERTVHAVTLVNQYVSHEGCLPQPDEMALVVCTLLG